MKRLTIVVLTFLLLSGALAACLTEQPMGATTGSVTVNGFMRKPAASKLVVGGNKAFAVLGSWQPISNTTASTPTFTIPAAGTEFCLVNIDTAVVWVTDKTTQTMSTAYHGLGKNDVLCFHSDGTQIIETAYINN